MKRLSNAFTLVELIVVITILAILGTVAFISLQGYSLDTRNSVRLSDGKTLKTSLELHVLQAGKYPIPTNSSAVMSGSVILWHTGEFGDQTATNLRSVSQTPMDPKSGELYGYSITDNQKEYQLNIPMENGLARHVNNTYALDAGRTPKIIGNYNGLFLIGSDKKYYAVPSLFASGTTFDIEDDQVSFTIADLGVTESNLSTNYDTLANNLKTTYAASVLATKTEYLEIVNITAGEAEDYGKALIGGDALTKNTTSQGQQGPTPKDGSNNSSTTPFTATMTSNNTPSPYKVFGTEDNGGYEAYRVFNQNDTDNGRYSSPISSELWITYVHDQPVLVNKYRIMQWRNGNRELYDFTLEGTNDEINSNADVSNANWTVLDTQTDFNANSWVWSNYMTFTNDTNYKAYRINVSRWGGAGSQLIEIDLIADET